MADCYLQSEFNFRPLLSDICGVRSTLMNACRRLERQMANTSVRQRAHYSKEWDELLPSEHEAYVDLQSHPEWVYPRYGGLCKLKRKCLPSGSKFCATLEFTPARLLLF